ncbi:MAG: hypothetical protein WCW33_01880 [Candidatus Babeliales bacterium]|jgi:hypothetical protein
MEDTNAGLKNPNSLFLLLISVCLFITYKPVLAAQIVPPASEAILHSNEFQNALQRTQNIVAHAVWEKPGKRGYRDFIDQESKTAITFMNIPGIVGLLTPLPAGTENDLEGIRAYAGLRESLKNAKSNIQTILQQLEQMDHDRDRYLAQHEKDTQQEKDDAEEDFNNRVDTQIQALQDILLPFHDWKKQIQDAITKINMMQIQRRERLQKLLIEAVINSPDPVITDALQDGIKSSGNQLLASKLDTALTVIKQLVDHIKTSDSVPRIVNDHLLINIPLWLTKLVNTTIDAITLLNGYNANVQSKKRFFEIVRDDLPLDILYEIGNKFATTIIMKKSIDDELEKPFLFMLAERRLLSSTSSQEILLLINAQIRNVTTSDIERIRYSEMRAALNRKFWLAARLVKARDATARN